MTAHENLQPTEGANRAACRRLSLRGEFLLALGPTLTVLLVLGPRRAMTAVLVVLERLALWPLARYRGR